MQREPFNKSVHHGWAVKKAATSKVPILSFWGYISSTKNKIREEKCKQSVVNSLWKTMVLQFTYTRGIKFSQIRCLCNWIICYVYDKSSKSISLSLLNPCEIELSMSYSLWLTPIHTFIITWFIIIIHFDTLFSV